MSKRNSKYFVNVQLSPSGKLVNEFKWVPASSTLFIFIYHMREEFQFMPDPKVIRKFRGRRGSHEYTRCLSIHMWTKLHKSFIYRKFQPLKNIRCSYPHMILGIYSSILGLFRGPRSLRYYWVGMIISKTPEYFYGKQTGWFWYSNV